LKEHHDDTSDEGNEGVVFKDVYIEGKAIEWQAAAMGMKWERLMSVK